jgi:hypothetical protein
MSFNGIGGFVSETGQIPWEFMVLYFAFALSFVFWYGRKTGGLSAFKTVDYVYIGIGAAFTVVWEFFIGPVLDRFLPSAATAYIGFGFFGRIFIIFLIAGLVRKVGAGMISMFIFNLLGDIFHYGFSGEPIFTVYETLTYGLLVDIAIAATRGNLFGVGLSSHHKVAAKSVNASKNLSDPSTLDRITAGLHDRGTLVGMFTGAVLGLSWSLPGVMYSGFFSPFLYGGFVNWASILFTTVSFIPGDIVLGAIAAVVAMRVARILGQ